MFVHDLSLLFIHLSPYLLTCLHIYLPIHLFICLFTYLYIFFIFLLANSLLYFSFIHSTVRTRIFESAFSCTTSTQCLDMVMLITMVLSPCCTRFVKFSLLQDEKHIGSSFVACYGIYQPILYFL